MIDQGPETHFQWQSWPGDNFLSQFLDLELLSGYSSEDSQIGESRFSVAQYSNAHRNAFRQGYDRAMNPWGKLVAIKRGTSRQGTARHAWQKPVLHRSNILSH